VDEIRQRRHGNRFGAIPPVARPEEGVGGGHERWGPGTGEASNAPVGDGGVSVEDGNGVVVGEVVVPYRSAVHTVEVSGLRDARGDVGDDGGEAEREEGDPFGEGDLGGLWGERIEWGGGPVHFDSFFPPLFSGLLK
jgi:hypothetical protein